MDMQDVLKELSLIFNVPVNLNKDSNVIRIGEPTEKFAIFDPKTLDLLGDLTIENFRNLVNEMIETGQVVAPINQDIPIVDITAERILILMSRIDIKNASKPDLVGLNAEQLITLMDNCRMSDLGKLNNQIAVEIMGWSFNELDRERVWKDSTGETVKIIINNKYFTICAHPWIDGVNKDDQISFNPIKNHYRNMIDWRQMVKNQIENKSL